MKAGFVGAIAGVAIGVASVLWSCTIDRPSESLKCTQNTDCAPDRLCQSGYCVIGMRPIDAKEIDAAVCPPACSGGCDFATTTCRITATGGGPVACLPGWNCEINCNTASACGAIDCTNGASCKVSCGAGNACGAITCNTKNCNVTCTGVAACGNVTCTSGNCTETCAGGAGSATCGNLTCGTGACARTCTGSAACGAMTCGGGTCAETCGSGSAACGNLTCGTGMCTANCNGSDGAASACGDVSCGNSCQCDVNCNLTTNQCPATMTCPDPPPGGTNACVNTASGNRCDSGLMANKCQKC